MKAWDEMEIDEYVDQLEARRGLLKGGDYDRLRTGLDVDWLKGWNLKKVGDKGRQKFKWSLSSVDDVLWAWQCERARRVMYIISKPRMYSSVVDGNGLGWHIKPKFYDSDHGFTIWLYRYRDGQVRDNMCLPTRMGEALVAAGYMTRREVEGCLSRLKEEVSR